MHIFIYLSIFLSVRHLLCFQTARKLHRMAAMLHSRYDATPLPSDRKAAHNAVTTTMHHNKPSSAALIESMEDGDVRDHELLNLMESGQRALLRYKDDAKPAWKDKRVCQSVHQQETFLQRKKPDAKPLSVGLHY